MWYEVTQSRISSSWDIFVGTPPLLNLLWVAMETMHFLKAQTAILFGQLCFAFKGVLIKQMIPIKICPRVQGKLSWPLDVL